MVDKETEIEAKDLISGDELNWKNQYWIIVNKWIADVSSFLEVNTEVVVLDAIGETEGIRKLIFMIPDDVVSIVTRPSQDDTV